MSSLNKALLIGRLGGDPQIRATAQGVQVANFTMATNRSYTDKGSGERVEQTEWHRVVAFGPKAEFVERVLGKGSLVYVEGRLQTRKWTDKQGVERYTTEVVADQIEALNGKSEAESAAQGGPSDGAAAEGDLFDDDIPF